MDGRVEVPVEEDDVERFAREGVVCLRGVVSDVWVERLRAATEWALVNPVANASLECGRDGSARFYGELFAWRRIQTFADFARQSGLGSVVGALTESASVQLFYDYLLVKEAGGSPATPWHQDWPYYPVTGDSICSTWVALDEVDSSNGGVQYVRGSHRWDRRFGPKSFTGSDALDRPELESIPDFDAERDHYDIAVYDLAPGDVLVHHTLTVHGAPENASDRRRRGLAVRWLCGPVCYDPKPATSPIMKERIEAAGLHPGDDLRGELFPQVSAAAEQLRA